MHIETEHLQRMMLPKVLWTATLEEVEPNVRSIITHYISHSEEVLAKGFGLYMSGSYGTGKSCAGAVVLKNFAARYKTCLFVSAQRIPDHIIKDTAFDDVESVESRMQRVDLLLIDEFIFRGDRFSEQSAETVIRRRMDEMKCTLITSNLTPLELQKKFPSLYDVVCGTMLVVKFGSVSRRIPKQDAIREFIGA